MSAGKVLGKVFQTVGSGLSFVPGPWSALGALFGVAGGIAGGVAQKKEQEAQQEPEQAQPEAAGPIVNTARPQQQQIQTPQQSQPVSNQTQPNMISSPPGAGEQQLARTIQMLLTGAGYGQD